MRVRLDCIQYWTVDLSHTERGIWIKTSKGWYKLAEPSRVKVPQPGADGSVSLSQEDVHAPMRAKFGLLSNLSKMLGELPLVNGAAHAMLTEHLNRSPKESHQLLTPMEEQWRENCGLNLDPFDLDLLRHEAKFVRAQLRDLTRV